MGQPKRKRQTKHRGNAAGSIEARGRTSKQVDEKGNKKKSAPTRTQSRAGVRPNKPPTWKGALGKAAFMALLLFLLFQLNIVGKELALGQKALFSLGAVLIYTPMSYLTDRAFYNMRLKREARASSGGRK